MCAGAWIPASAGMTGWVRELRLSRRGGLFGVEDGISQVLDVIGDLVDFAEFDGVIHGVVGGADTNDGIRVFDGLGGEDGDQVGHECLELPPGEVVGLPVELGELFMECGVIEPAAEGPLGNPGIAGGLGDGRGKCDDGQDGMLAGSET